MVVASCMVLGKVTRANACLYHEWYYESFCHSKFGSIQIGQNPEFQFSVCGKIIPFISTALSPVNHVTILVPVSAFPQE
jgi:hypothetical protein